MSGPLVAFIDVSRRLQLSPKGERERKPGEFPPRQVARLDRLRGRASIIASNAPLTVTNVAFSGNSAGNRGGGILNTGNGRLTLTNTIVAIESGAHPPASCCDGQGTVNGEEIVALGSTALGTVARTTCPDGIPAGGADVTVDHIIAAVNHGASTCSG